MIDDELGKLSRREEFNGKLLLCAGWALAVVTVAVEVGKKTSWPADGIARPLAYGICGDRHLGTSYVAMTCTMW